ncbi:hydroxymethylbilane synthase [Renibacterium salmoninarum]|uniref:hydroxymethylbilane synthase n=1 Tax=Renibacterium salmoninarum TaxID=1646 RepID=UPI0005A09BE4|nr:hydroxymethylbilane synthase [Renibacterium salmoninarum]
MPNRPAVETFKLGTRGSKLARTQSQLIADQLSAIGGFEVELVQIRTDGDVLTGPLSQMGGTGVFVTALREAVLNGSVDFAVHSLKDLPTAAAPGMKIAAIPARAEVRDALCSRSNRSLAELATGAKVGTGSPRRAAQLRAARADIEVIDIRGNVDTRLARLENDLDAVVLAAAGLGRIGRSAAISELFDDAVMLPAPGQGALAVETALDVPTELAAALAAIDDADSRLAVTAERALLARLEAGCSAPVGAFAQRKGSMLRLEACICSLDGSRVIRQAKATDGLAEVAATLLGIELAESMLADGAADLL